jgi:hypothetical protein
MLPQDTVGYLALTVPMSERRTPAITLGPLLELVLCALALVSAAVAIVTRRRVKLPPSMK